MASPKAQKKETGQKPLKLVLSQIFEHLTEVEPQKCSMLINRWPAIAGRYFAEHSKPRFGKAGKVVVCVDDSTKAFELNQRYKPAILKRLQSEFGEDEVKDIRFFVGELDRF